MNACEISVNDTYVSEGRVYHNKNMAWMANATCLKNAKIGWITARILGTYTGNMDTGNLRTGDICGK